MRKKFISAPIIIVVLLSIALLVIIVRQSTDKGPSFTGKEVPEFSVETRTQLSSDLHVLKKEHLKGQVTVINFFASWCSACKAEHSIVKDLTYRYGIKVYGIAVRDRPDQLELFLAKHGDPFQVLGLDKTGEVAHKWQVSGLPQTFVVDKEGIIRFHHLGALTMDVVEKELLPVFDKYSESK